MTYTIDKIRKQEVITITTPEIYPLKSQLFLVGDYNRDLIFDIKRREIENKDSTPLYFTLKGDFKYDDNVVKRYAEICLTTSQVVKWLNL